MTILISLLGVLWAVQVVAAIADVALKGVIIIESKLQLLAWLFIPVLPLLWAILKFLWRGFENFLELP